MAFAKRNQKSKNLQRNTNEILNTNEMVMNYSPGSPTQTQKTKTNRGNPLRQGVQFNSLSNMLKAFAVRNFVTKYGSPTKKNKRKSVNQALKNKAKK
tara:strand:- start:737 stop:1027 length:291 start_codon:yes stop_codon:yes gene_type:complete